MAVPFLVVDIARLLDASKVGQEAARTLAAQFDAFEAEQKKLLAGASGGTPKAQDAAAAKARQLEENTLKSLKDQQVALRKALLNRAQPFVEQAMKAAGASAVVDRVAVMMCDPALDITEKVMASVDALGPLYA